jgi:hypothetical protein
MSGVRPRHTRVSARSVAGSADLQVRPRKNRYRMAQEAKSRGGGDQRYPEKTGEAEASPQLARRYQLQRNVLIESLDCCYLSRGCAHIKPHVDNVGSYPKRIQSIEHQKPWTVSGVRLSHAHVVE